jgi:hypothetical protein
LDLTPSSNGRWLVKLSLPAFDCDRSCRVLLYRGLESGEWNTELVNIVAGSR